VRQEDSTTGRSDRTKITCRAVLLPLCRADSAFTSALI